MSTLMHAVAVGVAVNESDALVGALVLGEAGAGKSSLALMLVDSCPFRRAALVADDAVIVEAIDGALTARAPSALAGRIEVRGFGPAPVRHLSEVALRFAVDLSLASERVPPLREMRPLAGGPALPLYPLLWKGAEATAPARLRAMASALSGGQIGERQQDSGPSRRNGSA
ncbi:MAG: serine kinase [Parvularculaceae bacterium]|nr:serine kinase [Parvularculaceae bacterium]